MAGGKYWTDEQTKLFSEVYSSTPNSELLSLFPGRTRTSFISHASKLGIKKKATVREQGLALDASLTAHLTEAEKGYIAGIIDGEGHIGFNRRKGRNGRYVYQPRVSIANTSSALLDWLQNRLPDFKFYKNSMHSKLGTKPVYALTLCGNRQCTVFLRALLPYLIVKKPQAEIVAEGYLHLSDAERETAYNQLRSHRKIN